MKCPYCKTRIGKGGAYSIYMKIKGMGWLRPAGVKKGKCPNPKCK